MSSDLTARSLRCVYHQRLSPWVRSLRKSECRVSHERSDFSHASRCAAVHTSNSADTIARSSRPAAVCGFWVSQTMAYRCTCTAQRCVTATGNTSRTALSSPFWPSLTTNSGFAPRDLSRSRKVRQASKFSQAANHQPTGSEVSGFPASSATASCFTMDTPSTTSTRERADHLARGGFVQNGANHRYRVRTITPAPFRHIGYGCLAADPCEKQRLSAFVRDVTSRSCSRPVARHALPALPPCGCLAPSSHRLFALSTPLSVCIYGHTTINVPESR